MYFLILTSPDGDSYKILPDDCKPEDAFESNCQYLEDYEYMGIYVAKVNVDESFGFGAHGDFFGGKLLFSRDPKY